MRNSSLVRCGGGVMAFMRFARLRAKKPASGRMLLSDLRCSCNCLLMVHFQFLFEFRDSAVLDEAYGACGFSRGVRRLFGRKVFDVTHKEYGLFRVV